MSASIEIVVMSSGVDMTTTCPPTIEVDVAAIGPRGLPGGKGDPGPPGPLPDTSTLNLNGGYF